MTTRRWVWDRAQERLVPADEYYARAYAHVQAGPTVMRDIQPYRNVIDGRPITSRSEHRQFLKAHDLVEIGTEKVRAVEKPLSDPTPAVARAYDTVMEKACRKQKRRRKRA